MESIKATLEAESKAFEYIALQKDPFLDDIIRSVAIVQKFIIDRKLIIYGGTAIDYALRLQGDKIYPDDLLAVPDLDFYSPTNVKDAYELADILYQAGWKETRTINAEYARTMRVDIGNKHFIADISFVPKSVFEKIETIQFNGMLAVHPNFQRIDLHSSLSFPFGNPPREVIFHRWRKDIKRFNLLNKYYPLTYPDSHKQFKTISIAIKNPTRYVLTGVAAYCALYTALIKTHREIESDEDIIPVSFSITDRQIEFSSFERCLEIISKSPSKTAKRLALESIEKYEPYFNLVNPKTVGRLEDSNVILYDTHNSLLSTVSIEIGNSGSSDKEDNAIRISSVQYLLKYFISMYFAVGKSQLAETYLALYLSVLKMVVVAEDNPLTHPSLEVYGFENNNLAKQITLNRLYTELGEAEALPLPHNYYPARAEERGTTRHPDFDPERLEFFREEWRQIK